MQYVLRMQDTCWLKQWLCAHFHLLFCSDHRKWKEQHLFSRIWNAGLSKCNFILTKKEASDLCTGVQIKAKRLSWHEIVGQLCDVRLHENEFYATKITGYFNSSFHPFVFYLPENRRIYATVNDSFYLRTFVLVGIITSPLTSSWMGVTQSWSRPMAPFDPTASL